MFAFLRGTVARKTVDRVALDVGGAGYEVHVPGPVQQRLRVGAEAVLLTHCHIREDAFVIFGFLRDEELALFRMLLGINGVGPKVALAILSHLSVNEVGRAVLEQDVKAFTRVGGVGTKTAQRIVLEMNAKLGQDTELSAILGQAGAGEGAAESDDVVAALCAQGCTLNEARLAAKRARETLGPGVDDESVLREAFRSLARS